MTSRLWFQGQAVSRPTGQLGRHATSGYRYVCSLSDTLITPGTVNLEADATSRTLSPTQNILSTLHDASLDQIVAFVRAPESDDAELYATLSGRALLRTGLIIGVSSHVQKASRHRLTPSLLFLQAPVPVLLPSCTLH